MKLLTLNSKLLSGLLLGFSLHSFAGYPVDINSASVDELAQALDGVGQSKAEAIVAFRDQFGPFMEAQELIQVQGIGVATLERNRENIRLSADLESSQ